MQNLKRHGLAALLLLTLLVSSASAQPAAERAAKAGEIFQIKGFRGLRLFGAAVKERGFAHGFLLAEDILADLVAALQSLPLFNARQYEQLLPWANERFAWDSAAIAELDGMFEGMSAKLGATGLSVKALGREFTRQDLNALNVLADYFGPACSGFSVWNTRTTESEVLHARTLDFPIGPQAIKDQIIVVSEAITGDQPLRAWVAVGWPGLIVQYTAMNADGLVVCLHDGYNTQKAGSVADSFYPRGLLLRRILEQMDLSVSDPAQQIAQMINTKHAACGNLFHISWPKAAAEKSKLAPSVVLEFDSTNSMLNIRRMDDSDALVVTNHFLLRCPPLKCDRFEKMTAGLTILKTSGRIIGLSEARKVLMAAEKSVAAHSVYFFPDTRKLHIALTKDNVMSPRVPPTEFTLKELFQQK
ncbi:MAG: hypothetical protein V1899_08495 [Planctomycetota bacterium]